MNENSFNRSGFAEFIEVIRQIREFADFVASLSQVDGAVVLSTRLSIIGYGAEIRVNDRKLPPTFLQTVDKREQIDPLIYGTRHRSTIRFCRKFPGTLGFIFSQDGGIKAVKGSKNQVTIFPEINRMLYDFFV
jgi:DNA integrity scanning protein DisA with diadenylate cyclase activity